MCVWVKVRRSTKITPKTRQVFRFSKFFWGVDSIIQCFFLKDTIFGAEEILDFFYIVLKKGVLNKVGVIFLPFSQRVSPVMFKYFFTITLKVAIIVWAKGLSFCIFFEIFFKVFYCQMCSKFFDGIKFNWVFTIFLPTA